MKLVGIVAVVGIMIIASLFVLDIVDAAETRDILQKVLLVLAIIAFGGVAVSFMTRPKA